MVVLFKYKLPGNRLGGGACIAMQATNIVQYLDRDAESKLIAKLRRALIFSVLSIIMKNINEVYKTVDIITVALSIYFICTLISTGSLITTQTQRHYHITYVLHCACRQSVLVISDAVANSIHMRDVGTQYDNTLLLFISTTTFIAALTFVPKTYLCSVSHIDTDRFISRAYLAGQGLDQFCMACCSSFLACQTTRKMRTTKHLSSYKL
jgi:hypothetical protein